MFSDTNWFIVNLKINWWIRRLAEQWMIPGILERGLLACSSGGCGHRPQRWLCGLFAGLRAVLLPWRLAGVFWSCLVGPRRARRRCQPCLRHLVSTKFLISVQDLPSANFDQNSRIPATCDVSCCNRKFSRFPWVSRKPKSKQPSQGCFSERGSRIRDRGPKHPIARKARGSSGHIWHDRAS